MADAARRLRLPGDDGRVGQYTASEAAGLRRWHRVPPRSRTVFAAAHVTVDPLHPGRSEPDLIDWDATLGFRHFIWDLGLGVAEAMDTAQRGNGLSWEMARELIVRSGKEARAVDGALVCGATTDQLTPRQPPTLAEVAEAYIEQCDIITGAGGVPALMPSDALARIAPDSGAYLDVYDRVIRETSGPLVLHWLGEAFAPQLAGYWGSDDLDRAEEVVLEILSRHAARFQGIKVSLLDKGREMRLRERLPGSVRMFTGDDFNFVELIRGDGRSSSDALLGAFAAVAPIARQALHLLDEGDVAGYEATLGPTTALATHVFQVPTGDYKTGIVFLAYLNAHQDHFVMLHGAQSRRSVLHLSEAFRLADRAGALLDTEVAVLRMKRYLALAGVEQ